MTDFRQRMAETRAQEAGHMRELVSDYLAATADLEKRERLDQTRRKEFFQPHFDHLTGIVRASVITQCMIDVTKKVHDELLASLPDVDKITCGTGWHDIVHRFLAVGHQYPGWLFKSAGEKWGGLSLRYSCDPASFEACRTAEKEAFEQSLATCEKCGQPGRLRGGTRWRKTRCDDHARGYDD